MNVINTILILLLVLLQYRLWSGNGSLPELWHMEEIKAAQLEENEELKERNQALAAEVMDLKEGMEAIEERARSEMGMIQSGETFFQIINRPEVPPETGQGQN
jgi:cell division protein FtsB